MTRDQALNLVNLYDGQYPDHHKDTYLKYFSITNEAFDQKFRQMGE